MTVRQIKWQHVMRAIAVCGQNSLLTLSSARQGCRNNQTSLALSRVFLAIVC